MMKKIVLSLLTMIASFILLGCEKAEETIVTPKHYTITPFTTKGDKTELLLEKETYTSELLSGQKPGKITISTDVQFQTMDGFGAAMTESSAYLFSNMSNSQREAVMEDLFGNGIGISFVRIPMGASDFALSNYSYNDLEPGQTDLNMERFTLERDQQYVIPMLKLAKTQNPSLLLMGSPWSAPAWMKDNGSMNGGSMKTEYFDAYAKYFVKFIQGYTAEGLPIYAVTPQNEPLHQINTYPTMYMTAVDQVKFVQKLGTQFQSNNINTLIMAYDHNWDQTGYPLTVIGSPLSSPFVAGSAFHCYGGNVTAQGTVQKKYPDKGIWFTECSGGRWATSFSGNLSWNMENVFIGSINHYAKGVLMWNLALDENDGPTNGGCSNCRGVVTVHPDGSYTRNEEYYMIGHFSKFVQQGAKRILVETDRQSLLVTGFTNPDGSIVLVTHNKSSSPMFFNLTIDGRETEGSIPAMSVTSYVIRPL
jgi:glucosylceramidase